MKLMGIKWQVVSRSYLYIQEYFEAEKVIDQVNWFSAKIVYNFSNKV